MRNFRYISIFTAMLFAVGNLSSHPRNLKTATGDSDEVVVLNKADFLKKVYNYEKNPGKWVYEGELPCIIDFYADWCGPCKKTAPILEELATEYKGKIIIYQINVDKERELARLFGVSSIPMFLFVPAKENPQSTIGAISHASFVEIIEKFLLTVPK
jgi:thioredoxin